jgi:hypothetical protein
MNPLQAFGFVIAGALIAGALVGHLAESDLVYWQQSAVACWVR